MNNIVVYTCITNNYDLLKEIKYIDEGVSYICFTDNDKLTSKTWKIVYLDSNLIDLNLSFVKQQRFIKLCPHKLDCLNNYDISVWVDANIVINNSIKELVQLYHKDGCFLTTFKHPVRNCVYKEGDTCIRIKKDKKENIEPQLLGYKSEGYPENNGMLESNMLIRNHNLPNCKKLMDSWWEELKSKSHRDKLSFNYVVWKHHFEKFINYINQNEISKKYLMFLRTHK